jgi:hypothetical protein
MDNPSNSWCCPKCDETLTVPTGEMCVSCKGIFPSSTFEILETLGFPLHTLKIRKWAQDQGSPDTIELAKRFVDECYKPHPIADYCDAYDKYLQYFTHNLLVPEDALTLFATIAELVEKSMF